MSYYDKHEENAEHCTNLYNASLWKLAEMYCLPLDYVVRYRTWRWLSSELFRRVVWYKLTDENGDCKHLWNVVNFYETTRRNITQDIFTLVAMKTWNLMLQNRLEFYNSYNHNQRMLRFSLFTIYSRDSQTFRLKPPFTFKIFHASSPSTVLGN